jgi:NADH-quinone oxidoreductase subunit N
MTYGNLAALVQDNVVRLLAYSSIAQSGYFLLGVVAIGQSDLAVRSLILFAGAYAAMNLGAFAIVLYVGRDLRSFIGVGRTNPAAGVSMAVFMLSLVGIPPLAGFVGKFQLFGAAIDAGLTWLAVVAILNSVLSLGVYLRVVVPMYGQPKETLTSSRIAVAVWSIALFFTLAIGLAAQVVLGRIS